MTTKYFQVINLKRPDSPFRNAKTEAEAIAICEKGLPRDYMSSYDLTFRPAWTNRQGADFDALFKK